MGGGLSRRGEGSRRPDADVLDRPKPSRSQSGRMASTTDATPTDRSRPAPCGADDVGDIPTSSTEGRGLNDERRHPAPFGKPPSAGRREPRGGAVDGPIVAGGGLRDPRIRLDDVGIPSTSRSELPDESEASMRSVPHGPYCAAATSVARSGRQPVARRRSSHSRGRETSRFPAERWRTKMSTVTSRGVAPPRRSSLVYGWRRLVGATRHALTRRPTRRLPTAQHRDADPHGPIA